MPYGWFGEMVSTCGIYRAFVALQFLLCSTNNELLITLVLIEVKVKVKVKVKERRW